MSFFSRIWDGLKRGSQAIWNGLTSTVGSFFGGGTRSPDWSSAIGPLIGAGADWLSGQRANDSVASQQQTNIENQREFAQQGIRWKVEDAKAAGLHPLYALGGAGAAFAPNPVVIGSEGASQSMGQNLSRAAAAMTSYSERAARDAALVAARASAAKDLAIAGFYDSEKARNLQELQVRNSPETFADGPYGGIVSRVRAPLAQTSLNYGDNIRLEGVPEAPAVEGPAASMWREWILDSGVKIQLPNASTAAEALESVAENNLVLAAVLARNASVYGPGWAKRVRGSVPSFFWR